MPVTGRAPSSASSTRRGFTYVVGVTGAVSLQTQAQAPLQAKELAMQLPSRRFRTVTWREGTNAALSSPFAAIRVHRASRAAQPSETADEQWLLVELPSEELEPTKYFLSTLPADTPIKELVRLAKLRWRIERDYQEFKQELGLGNFEGRSSAAGFVGFVGFDRFPIASGSRPGGFILSFNNGRASAGL
jgi:SRSO17 transposase